MYDSIQARAPMHTNTSPDSTGNTTEMMNRLTYHPRSHMHTAFKQLYNTSDTPEPHHWISIPFTRLLKERAASNIDNFRWLSKLDIACQWYRRTCRHRIRGQTTNTTTRTYGLTPSPNTDDTTTWIGDIAFATHAWMHRQATTFPGDIRTSFDKNTTRYRAFHHTN